MKSNCLASTFCLLSWAFVAAPGAEPSIPANFRKAHESIKPQTGEWKWAKLPWHTRLAEAREKAAKEGKPLFVWTTGPHPLGNL